MQELILNFFPFNLDGHDTLFVQAFKFITKELSGVNQGQFIWRGGVISKLSLLVLLDNYRMTEGKEL
jgi:hypothetical protein